MDPTDNPRPAPPTNFDPVAEIYDQTRDKPSAAELSSLIQELQGTKTLELAVGTARLAKPLQEHGIDLTGIDVSQRMLARARAKQTLNLVRGQGQHLPFRDGVFDAVLVAHFLHLVPDWPNLMREITRVASNKLVSVDSRTVSSPLRPREIYLEKLKKKGFLPPVKYAGELLLAEKVKPVTMHLIEKAVETETMDSMLTMLEKRWLAVSWTVPDNLHRQVMEELKRELNGKTVSYTRESFLLSWRVQDLSAALPYL